MSQQASVKELFGSHEELVPFETFMRKALYDPSSGYYSSNISTVGRRGDFSTTATLHSVLGQSIAKWALREKSETLGLGFMATWNLIEVGAGDGSLAGDILSALGTVSRLRLTYHIVEASPTLRKEQEKKLQGSGRIQWHDSMERAIAACSGKALIVSNELIDAFPVAVVRWNGELWEGLFLRLSDDGSIEESFAPLPDKRKEQLASSVFSSWEKETIPLKKGQRCEIQLVEPWLRQWVPSWKAGSLLTIDYGDQFPDLYHRNPTGTLRGYYQGVRLQNDEVYDRFGHQDLTTDVNFTDLQSWTENLGLETVSLATQREYFEEQLPGIGAPGNLRKDSTLEFLMSPYGAGEAFKVLQQRKS